MTRTSDPAPRPAPRDDASALPQFIPVAAVAAQLGVSDDLVRGLIERGELVAHKFGRALRVSVPSVEEYLCRSRVHAARAVSTALTSSSETGSTTRPSVSAAASPSGRATEPSPSAPSPDSSPGRVLTFAERRARRRSRSTT